LSTTRQKMSQRSGVGAAIRPGFYDLCASDVIEARGRRHRRRGGGAPESGRDSRALARTRL